MQKYRKWTDEATGVNPFIIADPKGHSLIYNTMTIIKSLIVQCIVILLFPLFMLGSLLPFLSFIHYIFLLVAGNITSYDDNKFTNDLSKLSKKKTKLILSNFSSIFDVLYYMNRLSNPSFVIIHESSTGRQSYQTTNGLKCLIKIITQRQPFYQYYDDQNQYQNKQSFKELVLQANCSNIVLFYEGIRTNGLGTIQISKTLCQNLYVENGFMVCRISYSPRDQLYFNMFRSPVFNFWRQLGSFTLRNLKIRSQITDIQNIHNVNELRKDVDQFMSTNGSKLLQTCPQEYANFIEFFNKTQKSNYVNQSK